MTGPSHSNPYNQTPYEYPDWSEDPEEKFWSVPGEGDSQEEEDDREED